jgi:hypothetical protein
MSEIARVGMPDWARGFLGGFDLLRSHLQFLGLPPDLRNLLLTRLLCGALRSLGIFFSSDHRGR